MKRLVAVTLCVAAACLLTATGCRRNEDPPPNSANNMQPGMQPGYQQPPPGQPGYQQPPPGQPQQPPPTQPAGGQPAGGQPNIFGIPLPPIMGGAPAGGGQQGGGGQEVANNPSMGALATPVLTPLQQQHAGQNSRQVGETLTGNLQAGQFIKTQVQLQPSKCYTGIGQGGQPVTVELVVQVGMPPMAQSQPALISVFGSGKDCFKNATLLPIPAFFRVVAQGQGPVSAALYER
jgi:hypothetical protein